MSAPQPETTRTILTYTRSGGALRQGKIPAVSGMNIKLLRKNLLICALLSLRLTYISSILRHASQMCQGLDLNSCFCAHFHSLEDAFLLIENLESDCVVAKMAITGRGYTARNSTQASRPSASSLSVIRRVNSASWREYETNNCFIVDWIIEDAHRKIKHKLDTMYSNGQLISN